jgi:hypothetical protein
MKFSLVVHAMFVCVLFFATHTVKSQTSSAKKFTWLIQQNEQGSVMSLDIPYAVKKKTRYLTIIISKRKGEVRPDVVSVMLPAPVKKEDGMYVMFSEAQNRNGKHLIVRDTNMTANAKFSNCNSEFCTVQMNGGYLTGRSREKKYDVIENFQKYDEVTFLYFDKTGHQAVSVPLSTFKKQYKELQ